MIICDRVLVVEIDTFLCFMVTLFIPDCVEYLLYYKVVNVSFSTTESTPVKVFQSSLFFFSPLLEEKRDREREGGWGRLPTVAEVCVCVFVCVCVCVLQGGMTR